MSSKNFSARQHPKTEHSEMAFTQKLFAINEFKRLWRTLIVLLVRDLRKHYSYRAVKRFGKSFSPLQEEIFSRKNIFVNELIIAVLKVTTLYVGTVLLSIHTRRG